MVMLETIFFRALWGMIAFGETTETTPSMQALEMMSSMVELPESSIQTMTFWTDGPETI